MCHCNCLIQLPCVESYTTDLSYVLLLLVPNIQLLAYLWGHTETNASREPSRQQGLVRVF